MELTMLAGKVVSYLIGNLSEGKGVQKAKDEFTLALWNWIGPIFVKDDSPIQDLKADKDNPLNQSDVALKIEKYLNKNPSQIAAIENILESIEKAGGKPGATTIRQTHYGTGDNVGGDKNVK